MSKSHSSWGILVIGRADALSFKEFLTFDVIHLHSGTRLINGHEPLVARAFGKWGDYLNSRYMPAGERPEIYSLAEAEGKILAACSNCEALLAWSRPDSTDYEVRCEQCAEVYTAFPCPYCQVHNIRRSPGEDPAPCFRCKRAIICPKPTIVVAGRKTPLLLIALSSAAGLAICLSALFYSKSDPDVRTADTVRKDFIAYLRSLPNNPQALESADFLAINNYPLRFSLMPWEAEGYADGLFDGVDKDVLLNPTMGGCRFLTATRMKCSDSAYADYIPHIASTMVHELVHARNFKAIGCPLGYIDDEIVAYAYQYQFERNLAMAHRAPWLDAFDGRMRARGVPGCDPWWSCSLSKESSQKIMSMNLDINDQHELGHWFHVKLLSDGWDAYIQDRMELISEDSMQSTMPTIDTDPADVIAGYSQAANESRNELATPTTAQKEIFLRKYLSLAEAGIACWSDNAKVSLARNLVAVRLTATKSMLDSNKLASNRTNLFQDNGP